MSFIQVTSLPLQGKRVFVRADLNVPMKNGEITSDARISASMDTLLYCLAQGAKVMVTSHLGRPTEGQFNEEDSLKPVADNISQGLGKSVRLVRNWVNGSFSVADGELVVLENCRFNTGESTNSEALSRKYASLCDVFVMDAFGTAHRAEASTSGIARFAAMACAGLLVTRELEALSKALANPARPLVAIVGGSKVSTKLSLLETLSDRVDQLIVGGGIANTFLAATGLKIGRSLCEPALIPDARRIMDKMARNGILIPLPTDVMVGKRPDQAEPAILKDVRLLAENDMILDIGPDSARTLADHIQKAGTVVWNGPVGVFELDPFGEGTRVLANAIANTTAFTLAGGGDTIAAIQKYGIQNKVSYISTAGGAFLEYMEGKALPAITALEQRAIP